MYQDSLSVAGVAVCLSGETKTRLGRTCLIANPARMGPRLYACSKSESARMLKSSREADLAISQNQAALLACVNIQASRVQELRQEN